MLAIAPREALRYPVADKHDRTVVPEGLRMADSHSHLDSCIAEVWELMERIGHETADSPGITRAAWSRNEETAADGVRDFARRHGLVSAGTTRQFAEAGGMLSVGPERSHLIERSVAFADRILRGARPQDLPVEEPSRYALVVNLATAGLMGRDIPRQLLQRADEVIE